MDELTMEQYREYLVKRIIQLNKITEMFEEELSGFSSSNSILNLYLKAYAALDDLMDRLFILDNAQDIS